MAPKPTERRDWNWKHCKPATKTAQWFSVSCCNSRQPSDPPPQTHGSEEEQGQTAHCYLVQLPAQSDCHDQNTCNKSYRSQVTNADSFLCSMHRNKCRSEGKGRGSQAGDMRKMPFLWFRSDGTAPGLALGSEIYTERTEPEDSNLLNTSTPRAH